jgi:hypothetical protein
MGQRQKKDLSCLIAKHIELLVISIRLQQKKCDHAKSAQANELVEGDGLFHEF